MWRVRAVRRAAGEVELGVAQKQLVVRGVTNQSTGYCPEPSCFGEIAAALVRVGVSATGRAVARLHLPAMSQVRSDRHREEDDFECAVCATPLPKEWNFGA